MDFSIVILTFNRRDRIKHQLELTRNLSLGGTKLEIIIVDNASETRIDDLISDDPRIKLVRNEKNLGAVGRNKGMQIARGKIIITLDDDVYGISDENLYHLKELFQDSGIAAVNFKVIEEGTGRIANWSHPYDEVFFHDRRLETTSISEGAVAFRRSALQAVGFYPEYFFISHEGPDLALRFINNSWRVIYTPEIKVKHGYEKIGRPGWRRYYYDTRNYLWLVLRNYPVKLGIKTLFIGWGSTFVYSIRDGFLKYWFKAVFDAFGGAGQAIVDRAPLSHEAVKKIQFIEKNKPDFFKMVKKRLFGKEVRI